jgi:hypothetical protein
VSRLDIEVFAVPGDCRHTAEELADLGATCDRTTDALIRHGHLNDADFSGLAADAFVRRTTALATRADVLADRAQTVSRALCAYADGIDAVRALMHRARRVAEPHLVTSATEIFSPDSADTHVPLGPARLAARWEAWRQAVDLWREARALEDRTEADLRAALAHRPLIPVAPPRHRHVPETRHPDHHDSPPPIVEPPVTAPPPDPHHHVAQQHDGHEEHHAHADLWTPQHHAHAELWTPPHHEGHEHTEPPPVCHTSQFQPPHPPHPIPKPDAGHDQPAPSKEEPHAVR